jgi:hypothetical protein
VFVGVVGRSAVFVGRQKAVAGVVIVFVDVICRHHRDRVSRDKGKRIKDDINTAARSNRSKSSTLRSVQVV